MKALIFRYDQYKWLIGILLSYVLLSSASAAEIRPKIWFNPLTSDLNSTDGKLEFARHDFPALIDSDIGWSIASSRISTFVIPGNVIWSYPDLPKLSAFVAAHNWKFGLSVGMIFTEGKCGKGVEGMSQDSDSNKEAVNIAKMWHNAHGRLDYIVMDSPMYFSVYEGKDCHFTIKEAAEKAGATLKGILKEYPRIRVLDAEGPGRVSNDRWLADMHEWLMDFRVASGHPVDAVGLDLHWSDLRPGNTWQETARRSVIFFHRYGVATGLGIDAEVVPGMSVEGWMAKNREHIYQAQRAHLGLDFIGIAEWMNVVQKNLPESDSNAYTSLVNVAFDAFK